MKWDHSLIDTLEWGNQISHKEDKIKIADLIASKVENGQVIGVGSGSTSYLALVRIAERIRTEHLSILAIPTSLEIRMTCAQLGIPVTSLFSHKPDWTFDGADEVDAHFNLIKGRGGAMFKEKLLICSSPQTYILVDPSKQVERLGTKFPIPVEIFPQALTYVEDRLHHLNPREIKLRMGQGKDGPIITENGNMILDVWMDHIPENTESTLKSITGVLESGLFMNYKVEVLGLTS
ncbi:MAG: ribose 5-phosphate isomerase A [Parabacteroides sp.]|nr:ribose 5-phosphate isomerase A [Parabacteroides sp.]